MLFDPADLDSLRKSLSTLEKGFAELPAHSPEIDRDALDAVLVEAAEKMQDNYPYHHPLYAGQMLKPPHPVARLSNWPNMGSFLRDYSSSRSKYIKNS